MDCKETAAGGIGELAARADAVAGFLKGAIAKSALADGFDPIKNAHPAVNAWYVALARDVFLPNAALFSYLVALGEFAIGLALIIGLVTRFSAVMSVLLSLSLLMAGATSTLPQMLAIGVALGCSLRSCLKRGSGEA